MLLEALDWAAAAAASGDAARLLAAQADLLGVMSDARGGLRSGPAGNAAWQPALHALEVGVAVGRWHWQGAPGSREYDGVGMLVTVIRGLKFRTAPREFIATGVVSWPKIH